MSVQPEEVAGQDRAWLNGVEGLTYLLRYCIRYNDEYETDSGLRSNYRLGIGQNHLENKWGRHVLGALAERAEQLGLTALTAEPHHGTGFARPVAHLLNLPFVAYRYVEGALQTHYTEGGTEADIHRSDARVGVITALRTTGHRTERFVAAAELDPATVQATAILDRGKDVPGVETYAKAIDYTRDHPSEPPAHMTNSFPYGALVKLKLPLMLDWSSHEDRRL